MSSHNLSRAMDSATQAWQAARDARFWIRKEGQRQQVQAIDFHKTSGQHLDVQVWGVWLELTVQFYHGEQATRYSPEQPAEMEIDGIAGDLGVLINALAEDHPEILLTIEKEAWAVINDPETL